MYIYIYAYPDSSLQTNQVVYKLALLLFPTPKSGEPLDDDDDDDDDDGDRAGWGCYFCWLG